MYFIQTEAVLRMSETQKTSESFSKPPYVPPLEWKKTHPKLSLSLAKSGKVFDIVVLTQS